MQLFQKNSRRIKSLFLIFLTNFFKILISIGVTFLLPRTFTLNDYGFYKLYILFAVYLGLFNFGLVDGIYLLYGGKRFEDLDKTTFRSYFKFLLLIIFIFFTIIVILSLLFLDYNLSVISFFLALNLVSINITGFFQVLSQAISRFNEYSIRTLITSLFTFFVVLIMYFGSISNYYLYLLFITIVNFTVTIWYIYTYRDLIFGRSVRFINSIKLSFKVLFSGIPLLLSNLSTLLLVNIDKQFVLIYFNISDFAIYSFSYSMLSIITAVISAGGIIIYPSLKTAPLNYSSSYYSKINKLVISLILILLIVYFPLSIIIPYFLPSYETSIPIVRIALPGLIFMSSIQIVKHNFYKLYNLNFKYLITSIIVLLLNIILIISAIQIFGSLISISISFLVGLSFWYIITEIQMSKIQNIDWFKNLILIITGVIGYYYTTNLNNVFYGGIIYVSFLIVLLLVSYHKEITIVRKF